MITGASRETLITEMYPYSSMLRPMDCERFIRAMMCITFRIPNRIRVGFSHLLHRLKTRMRSVIYRHSAHMRISVQQKKTDRLALMDSCRMTSLRLTCAFVKMIGLSAFTASSSKHISFSSIRFGSSTTYWLPPIMPMRDCFSSFDR